MRWTCPKCGKKLEISNEQLIANDGVIVCPQCLLQARQPIPTARVAAKYDKADADTTPPKRTKNSTPPPHKPRMKQAKTSYRYTGLSGDNNRATRPSTKKKSTKKKSKKKKGKDEGMSPLGCLGRTIIFTLVLFAVYVFFGLLLESFQ
ncbi:MAG: hypothetical protein IJK93_06345 [Muribaculaceae bacterium]|nr:hypothetical protein [Muribaculaceae bacterium]